MVTVSDFVSLKFTPDLTHAGVLYACRSLPHTYDRMGGTTFDRLRRIVAGVAVELGLRRYLAERDVPFDVFGATPFTEPDRYDLALGGRRCDLKSYMILHKDRIRQVRRQPEMLLDAPALVPSDQFLSARLGYEDLYIFAVLTALITPTELELGRALAAEQPSFILHTLPERWSRPARWASLGSLAVKSDTSVSIQVELGGQDAARAFQTEAFTLAPRQRVQAQQDFYSATYLQADRVPDGLVGVFSPTLGETYLAATDTWGNIWVYGLEITILGYLSVGEFRRRAKRLSAGSRVLQYPRTRTENMVVPIRRLRPMEDLFVRVKNWSHRE